MEPHRTPRATSETASRAPDPTAAAVVGRHVLGRFGLLGRLRNGGLSLTDVLFPHTSPPVLLLLLLLRGHCQQHDSQTHRCRLLASPGGNLCCPPLPASCATTAIGVLKKERTGLRHPSVICVDNVFFLFVFLLPVILMQRLSCLDWDGGECCARAVHYLGDRGGLLCLSFFPSPPPRFPSFVIFSASRLTTRGSFASANDVERTKLLGYLARHLGAF